MSRCKRLVDLRTPWFWVLVLWYGPHDDEPYCRIEMWPPCHASERIVKRGRGVLRLRRWGLSCSWTWERVWFPPWAFIDRPTDPKYVEPSNAPEEHPHDVTFVEKD